MALIPVAALFSVLRGGGVTPGYALKNFDRSFSESFALKGAFGGLLNFAERMFGKREINGVIIGGEQLFRKFPEPSRESCEYNIKLIKDFAERNLCAPFLMIVPSAIEIQKKGLPPYAASWSQKDTIKGILSALGDSVAPIDVYQALFNNKNAYIYYRTEDSWTVEGAYYAYVEAGKAMKYEGLAIDMFSVKNEDSDYYGALYYLAGSPDIKPDIVRSFSGAYYSPEALEQIYKYNQDKTNPAVINTEATSSMSLIIFSDGYGDLLAPFLTLYYSKITVMDLSRLGDVKLNPGSYNHVLIVGGIENFSQNRIGAPSE